MASPSDEIGVRRDVLSLTLCYDGHVLVYPQVLVEGKASSRAAVLNRPGHLNALTTTMVRAAILLFLPRSDGCIAVVLNVAVLVCADGD